MFRRLIIVAAVMLLVGGTAFVLLFREQLASRFTAEGRRARTLERLNDSGTVVRRSCGLGEAHVDAARWRDLSAGDQERAAAALASWCADQGGASTLTVIDSNTRTTLAKWDGSRLQTR
jgi:hypothetical protein